MYIHQLYIKNFRCFDALDLEFNNSIIVISGDNGSGKSSVLEALHYGCYLRSFRTHLPKELINFDQDNFFIKITLNDGSADGTNHELQIGVSKKKRLVKVNGQPITSYKELLKLYRVITITEDDIMLIKGSPEGRRLFLDQALTLEHPEFLLHTRRYKHILENRNALLQSRNFSDESYMLWTEQLWNETVIIQHYRQKKLQMLQERTTAMLASSFSEDVALVFEYNAKKMSVGQSFADFCIRLDDLKAAETFMKRSCFGAHLDDFSIEFCKKSSRSICFKRATKTYSNAYENSSNARNYSKQRTVCFFT